MPHKTVPAPTIFVPTIEQWTAPSDEVIRRRRKFSVVVYAPKYDEELREEAEVEVLEDGSFSVEITRVGKNSRWREHLGTFDNYEDAKAELFEKFNELFNRPSKNAIQHGARPNWKVWDVDMYGNIRHWNSPAQEVKRSISIIEGDEAKSVIEARVESVEVTPKGKIKSYTIRIPSTKIPSTISVRTLYPSYFQHLRQAHAKKVRRLARAKRRKNI